MSALRAIVALALLASAHGAMGAGGDATRLGELINDYRVQHGRKPLAPVATLATLAQEHAGWMVKNGRLSHEGFEERFARARSPHCVENVGSNARTPQAAFAAWRDSPVHEHNLLDSDIARMGIAIDGGYVAFFACR